MPKISQQKRDKIAEQILHILFDKTPKPLFTAEIAREAARDEEFTKALLHELKEKNFITDVNKNGSGKPYLRRQRWRLTNQTYNAYSKHQN
jgi:predicted transcriptional regulator